MTPAHPHAEPPLDPARTPDLHAPESTTARPAAMQITQIPGATPEEMEHFWLKYVYQGDRLPQLTLRALLMGSAIGVVMCLSNLYVGLKTGWGLGVVITAVIISYALYSTLSKVAPAWFGSNLSILENNAMASTASAAGYSTGGTMVSATAAYLLLHRTHIAWPTLVLWTFFLSALGVFFAIPMKRQMINIEQLKFPTGLAAAETLRSLYATGRAAQSKARALGLAALLGAAVAWARDGMRSIAACRARHLFLPEHLALPGSLGGLSLQSLTISFENSLIMVGAGAIMGLKVTLSMLLGAGICYGVLAPQMIKLGAITAVGYRGIVAWSLWPGATLMVVSSLLQFVLQGKTMLRAFKGLGESLGWRRARRSALPGNAPTRASDPLAAIEVPGSWFLGGFLLLAVGTVAVAHHGFAIPWHYGALAVLLSFVLCIVACRATGETDTTPVGALGKITQLTYGVLIPQNMTANLMTASITGNTASAAADLLSDLKSGYLLGANPRKQFLAQLAGCLVGTAIIVPFFYLLVPDASVLGSDRFPAPAAHVWAAVAQLLSTGVASLHPTVRVAVAWAAVVGLLLPLAERLLPQRWRRFLPSPMGLGLAMVIPAWNTLSMVLGAVLVWALGRVWRRQTEHFTVATASGLIAGESIVGVIVALLGALGLLA